MTLSYPLDRTKTAAMLQLQQRIAAIRYAFELIQFCTKRKIQLFIKQRQENNVFDINQHPLILSSNFSVFDDYDDDLLEEIIGVFLDSVKYIYCVSCF